ncbi:MAG: type II toxin-antitoxin system VapC family toxin [Polaromonas sp.]|nr:type II toxin-antitoxin system VapC family toxin [Polaromonas sp.]
MGTARADLFASIIDSPANLRVPVITVYEVIKKVRRELGDDVASRAVVLMQRSPIIDIDLRLVMDGLTNGLPVADSLIYATAKSMGAVVWTQDQHFEGLPNVKYFEKSTTV